MTDQGSFNPSRRAALRFGATAIASAGLGAVAWNASSCSRAEPATGAKLPFAGQTLRLFVYSGAWEKTFREAFVPTFEKKTGAQVVLDPGWWDSIPKLKASPKGKPAFDLVLTDATQGCPSIREGMFAQLDLTAIPNHKRMSPAALDHWVYREGYGITFPESAMTLAWNKKLIGFEPSGWGDLLRDDVKGRLGLYNSFYMSLYTLACAKVAADGRPGTAAKEVNDNISGVIQFARDNRERVKYWWPTSTDMVQNLAQENCAIGNMHSPDVLPALRSDANLGATVPDADRAFVLLMWVVPSDTPNRALSHAAIDHILGDDFQTAFARRGSATAIPAVASAVASQDTTWGRIYPSTEAQMRAVKYYPYDAYFKDWDGIVKAWDQEILRKKA